MRLLLVENHVVFAAIVTRQFLHLHAVTLVPSVAEARLQLQGVQFDAVLVDFDLEDATGDVLVRELVGNGFAGRIIGIPSHDEGNASLLTAGAHAFCSKGRFQEIASILDLPR